MITLKKCLSCLVLCILLFGCNKSISKIQNETPCPPSYVERKEGVEYQWRSELSDGKGCCAYFEKGGFGRKRDWRCISVSPRHKNPLW